MNTSRTTATLYEQAAADLLALHERAPTDTDRQAVLSVGLLLHLLSDGDVYEGARACLAPIVALAAAQPWYETWSPPSARSSRRGGAMAWLSYLCSTTWGGEAAHALRGQLGSIWSGS